MRSSSDGSHVYFVATGKLTEAENGLHQRASTSAFNLYVVNTLAGHTGELGFVAKLPGEDRELWGRGCPSESLGVACDDATRPAQSTPDGRYLVFDTHEHLVSEDENGCPHAAETCPEEAVYRYDAESHELTWLSRPALGSSATNERKDSTIAALPGIHGAMADYADVDRAISEDGQYVIFTSAEALQSNDANGASDVYLWHCSEECKSPTEDGTVGMISDGQDKSGVGASAISGSGSDIVFSTHTALVPQDTDPLADVYDARVGGGVQAPSVSACSGEGCQGALGTLPEFALAGSEVFTGGANLAHVTAPSDGPQPTAKRGTSHVNGKPKKRRARRRARSKRG